MLNLRINNADYLDLEAETAISFTLINPAFDARGVARTFTYPVTIPLTERTLQHIKHANRLDTQTRQKYLPADVQLDGNDFEQGRALVQEYTDQEMQIAFQNDSLSQLDGLNRIKLRDLLGTINIPQTTQARLALTPGAGPNFSITINGNLYTSGGLGIDRIVAINDLVQDILDDYPGTVQYDSVNDLMIFTVEEGPYGVQFTVTNFTENDRTTNADAQEQNLQAYITAAAAGNEPVAFPVVYAPQFYPRNLRFRRYINHRIGGVYLTNDTDTEFGWLTTYVPYVRLRYILDQLAAELGITDIVFDLPTAEAADLNDLLIYNNVSLDELQYDIFIPEGYSTEKNGFKTTINLADHVPDYTADELLNRLRQSFNLHIAFERNRLFLRKNIDQVTQSPEDWTQRTDPAYQRTTNEGGGVRLQFAEDTSKNTAVHDAYDIGDASNEYTLPFRPLHDRTIPLFESGNARWKIVAIEEQSGTSEPLDLETENQTLRLFFDRGQQPNENDDLYWQGSIEATNYDGDSIGALSLALAPTNGLYATFWRGWTQFLFSPTITRVTSLNLGMLLLLRKWRNPHVYIYHHDGAVRCVVERVQLNLSRKGMSRAKIDYRKFEP